jgi:hypothetical protein
MNNKPITRVIIGGYVFMLMLSVGDMFGGDIGKLMSALALLAATYVLLVEFPWTAIINLLQGKQQKKTP